MYTQHLFIGVVSILYCSTFCVAQNNAVGDKCVTDDGKNGTCVIVDECPDALREIKNLGRPKICSFALMKPIVCCAFENKETQDTKQSPESIAHQKCFEYVHDQSQITEAPMEEPRPPGAVNGIPAVPKEFSHMAAIGFQGEGKIDWLCGGSLISETFVLTAAHCTSYVGGTAKWVRLGDLNLLSTDDDAEPEDYEIKRRINHPEYNRRTKHNDIALLELSRNVKMSSYVQPACLHTDDVIEGNLTATGWGVVEFAGNPSDHLLKVYLEPFSYDRCHEIYKTQNLSQQSQLCIGSKAEKVMDTCQGDSGGPLQVPYPFLENHYIIVGVTSFGKSCGVKNIPAIYSRVKHYLPWITSIVWPQ